MATSKTYYAQPTQTVDFDQLMSELEGMPSDSPDVDTLPERSAARAAGDIALSLGQGAIGSVKSITDLAGAENPVSQGLGGMSEYLGNQKSEQSKAVLAPNLERIKEAEASGSTLEEAKAYMEMLLDQPGEFLAQGVGSFATLGIGKIAQAIKLGRIALASGMPKAAFLASKAGVEAIKEAAKFGFKANIGVGVAQGVGAVKSSQYEQAYNNAIAQGMPEDQAQALAAEAQRYGGSGTMQQALGGALGGVAASTGPIERMVVGKGAAQSGVMASMGKGLLVEGGTEGAQGAQERFAGNTAAIDSGVLAPDQRMRGVVGQGLMDGTVGGVLGAAVGPFEAQAPVNMPNEPVPPGPMTRATDKAPATEPVSPPAPLPQPAPEQAQALLAHANERARLIEEKANGTKDQKITGPDGKPMVVPGRPKEFLTPDEKEELALLKEHGGDASVLAGLYPEVVPAAPAALAVPQAPSVPPVPEDVAQQVAEPEPAPVVPMEAAADPLTAEISAYASDMGEVSPQMVAAKFGVTVERAQQILADMGRDADTPSVDELFPAPDAAQPDDILNPKGEPFKTLMAARNAAKTTPGAVIEVPGGYAIRPQERTLDQAQNTAKPAQESATESGAAPAPAVRSAGVPGVDQPGAVPALNDINDVMVTPELDAVHAAATSPLNDLPEPTDAQKKAGNYKVGKIRMSGLDISIENPQGSERRGVDPDGNEWTTPMRDHYGYFKGTTAADGDKLDVFIKPGTPQDYAGPVFVVDQVDPKTGKFDEHKVVFGAADQAEAEAIYRRNYSADWQGLANITALPMPAFKAWASSKETRKPLGAITEQANVQNAAPGTEAQAAAAPVKAPAPAGSDAAATGAGAAARDAGAVEAAGVTQQELERVDNEERIGKPALRDRIASGREPKYEWNTQENQYTAKASDGVVAGDATAYKVKLTLTDAEKKAAKRADAEMDWAETQEERATAQKQLTDALRPAVDRALAEKSKAAPSVGSPETAGAADQPKRETAIERRNRLIAERETAAASQPEASAADAPESQAEKKAKKQATQSQEKPDRVEQRKTLEQIAERLGITVHKGATGWHATGDSVSIPDADVDAQGAIHPNHVFAHEIAHVVMTKRGFTFQGFPKAEVVKRVVNYDALVAASKEFRPGVHNHENDRFRRHAMKPNEVMADGIASVLLGDKPISLIEPLMEFTGMTRRDLGLDDATANAPPSDPVKPDPEPDGQWSVAENGFTGRPVYRYTPEPRIHWATVQNPSNGVYAIEYRIGDKVVSSEELGDSLNKVKFHVAEKVAELDAKQASHQDPGEKAEPATKAVVNDSLKTAAKNEDSKPSEMRKWLLGEIDKALLQAPDRADYDEAVKRVGEKDAIAMFTGTGILGKNSETGTVAFDVPGDGKFKVRNSVRGLLEFRKNVSASLGFKDSGQKTVGPAKNDGVQGGSGGQMAAITNMIEEGDFEAARDYAEAVGIKLEDVKVPRGERKPQWDQFLKDGTVPPPPDTRPIPPQRTPAQIAEDERLAKEAEAKKPKDTGWNMAGTGYGGKRYIGRNITLDDGRKVVARVYENAGVYEEAEVRVDGERKFTVTDRNNAQGKADAFIKTLMSSAGATVVVDKAAVAPESVTGKDLRERISAWAKAKWGDGKNEDVKNPKWGSDITITWQGIKHAISNANDPELRLIAGITELVGRASHVESHPDKRGRDDVKAVHTFSVKATLGDEALDVGIVVRELKDGHKFYDHFIIKSETPSGISGSASSVVSDGLGTPATDGVGESVSQPPAGYKPAGEPFYIKGTLTQGYAPFAPGERVTMKDSAGQSGVVESLTSPDDGGVFSGAMVKFDNGSTQIVKFGKLDAEAARAAPDDTPKLTRAEAAELMTWQDMGTTDGVKRHILTFYRSKEDADAKRGRMTVATVTKGDRSATAWMVDGDDQTFGPLALAKKRAMEIGMAKAVADGFVDAAPAQQEAQQAADDRANPEQVSRSGANVDDFGEKLPPARRAMAAKLSEELAPVAQAFDSLFDTIQTKEDDAGNVVMFSRSTGSPSGITKQSATQIVDAIKARWANAPEVVVVQDMQDPLVPEAVRKVDAQQRSQGAAGEPEGFWYGGKAYIVAGALSTPGDVVRVLLHEVLGHYGLRGTFGDSLAPILRQIASLRRNEIVVKAFEYGLVPKNLNPRATMQEVWAAMSDAQRMQAAEEVLAVMAQTKPEMGYVKRAIAAIRAWLRKNVPGFQDMKLTDNDIIGQFILPARRFVEQGPAAARAGRSGSGALPALSFSMSGDQNPDIRFSRSAEAPNDPRQFAEAASEAVHDLFNHPGKLGMWHKSVGTQYNLAQRSPAFKKVYDRVQEFLGDVSFHATEAADLAPSILPKLDTWRDIFRSPLTPEDNKAIAAPIFEGTLAWRRDEAGKPVRMSDVEAAAGDLTIDQKSQRLLRGEHVTERMLKMWRGLPVDQYEKIIEGKFEREMLGAGIVWTDDELKEIFNLSPKQIELYHEFRNATDKSLASLAISDMLRFGGKDTAELTEKAMAAEDANVAAVMLRDHLFELADQDDDRRAVLIDTANKMIEKADKVQGLMDRGYAPLSRFGHYSLDVVDAEGERVYFGLFESKAEANKMARAMRINFPGAEISQGTMSEEAYKLFAGVSPETLELFGGMLGLESEGSSAKDQVFQEYLKLAKGNRSAMKRLIQRKGIAGFSEDAGRVLAGFIYSNARQTASSLHMGAMAEAASAIPNQQGELKDAALKLVDYIKNPVEEAAKFRGLLFAQYLGGSIASAMVNMLQPIQVTIPYLSQFGGARGAALEMKRALGDVLKKTTGDKDLDEALKTAEEQGIVAPQEVHQLMAQAQGQGSLKSGDGTVMGNARAKAGNAVSKVSLAWGKAFGAAEQFNRRLTFIASYRLAKKQGLGNPVAFAEKTIAETQFVYNKGNKGRWARGAVGGTIFTFKQYSISYLELLSRMATAGEPGSPERAAGRKAALMAVGVLLLMGGAGGLPFMEDVEDLIDGFMQRVLGYNFSTKQKRKELLAEVFGEELARFVESGVSGLPGVPIDVSGRLGLPNLLPGTGLFVKKDNYSRDIVDAVGPAGDMIRRGFTAAGQLLGGDVGKAVETISPVAARNLIKAVDMANMGMYRDQDGKKILDADGYEALAKGIGFQPNAVARYQEAAFTGQRMISLNKMTESEIADRWAIGIFEQDQGKVQAARAALQEWNRKNPESPIRINMAQIVKRVRAMRMPKAERIAKTAPKEIRAAVRRELMAEDR